VGRFVKYILHRIAGWEGKLSASHFHLAAEAGMCPRRYLCPGHTYLCAAAIPHLQIPDRQRIVSPANLDMGSTTKVQLSGAWTSLQQLTHLHLNTAADRLPGINCIANQPALEVLKISLTGNGGYPWERFHMTPLISRRMPLRELRINCHLPNHE